LCCQELTLVTCLVWIELSSFVFLPDSFLLTHPLLLVTFMSARRAPHCGKGLPRAPQSTWQGACRAPQSAWLPWHRAPPPAQPPGAPRIHAWCSSIHTIGPPYRGPYHPYHAIPCTIPSIPYHTVRHTKSTECGGVRWRAVWRCLGPGQHGAPVVNDHGHRPGLIHTTLGGSGHRTAQHSAAHHITAQHCTSLHSTAQQVRDSI
jgi:hypothetical protein